MTDDWRTRYDNERPHDSLNDMMPVDYLQPTIHPETLI